MEFQILWVFNFTNLIICSGNTLPYKFMMLLTGTVREGHETGRGGIC